MAATTDPIPTPADSADVVVRPYHHCSLPTLRGCGERNQMVLENMGLVHYWAKRYWDIPWFRKGGQSYDDLVQEGMMILMRMAELWDPEKGTFGTYAGGALRNKMLRYCLESGIIHVPCAFSPGGKEIHRERKRVADSIMTGGYSLHESETDSGGIPEAAVRVIVEDVLERLSWQEQWLIRCYYFKHMDLTEIGKKVGLTKQRVCQVLHRALGKLRVYLKPEEDCYETLTR